MAKKQYPSDKQDQFMIRFPEGMRDRIKKAASRSGRSMNAEIVAALETYYPEEPTIEEVLDRVHKAIELAKEPYVLPYRQTLIDALDELSDQITSGLELDQFRAPALDYNSIGSVVERHNRWMRVQKYGVETEDFKRELRRGMFSRQPGDRVLYYLDLLDANRGDEVLKDLRLSETKFADKPAALKALRDHFEEFYRENWGDPDDPPPWDEGF